MEVIEEAPRKTPVAGTFDICVIGGSCTGVFAAVRAARLGAKVALVEVQNCFGGVATAGMVCVWHTLFDTEFKKKIIGGLTEEVITRLLTRSAATCQPNNPSIGCTFNSEELKLELDELVLEHGITPFLHTRFCAPVVENNKIRAILVENKNGRSAIAAEVFIDATGDGDLAAALGLPCTIDAHLQPPTTCAKIGGLDDLDLNDLLREHREEFRLPEDSGWACRLPGSTDVKMYAITHVFNTDASDAGQLTRAELEGRRGIRALMDMARKYKGKTPTLYALPSYIGIRETRRFHTEHILSEDEVLSGTAFPDAIAYGSYRVDVHNPSGGGFVFKYLDGTTESIGPNGSVQGRWRPQTPTNPTFYQIPYRCLYTNRVQNLLLAGRMIGTDKGAFGGIRVMVNLNQTGEAAGVAAVLAVRDRLGVSEISIPELRTKLAAGGSLLH